MRDVVDMNLLKSHGYLTDAFRKGATDKKSQLFDEIRAKLKIPQVIIKKEKIRKKFFTNK
jgi:hypothetical protein